MNAHPSFISAALIQTMVESALAEDLGDGDMTAQLIPAERTALATVITREAACLCGAAWLTHTFLRLDPTINVVWHYNDGDMLAADATLCTISGSARAILSGERTALNFVQLLSGTATTTKRYVKLLEGTTTRLLDTRKTIPGFRLAQKYAVLCGGGNNHRLGLYDGFLIKENHIAAAGSITQAVMVARQQRPNKSIEVEVENITQLDEAIHCQADMALLDNFNDAQILSAIAHNAGRIKLEVSGNIDETRLRSLATIGVDYVSSGALTKHVRAIDLSMRFMTVPQ